MEKTLDNLERQIDLLARGLDNLREIVQLLRMKREEERQPTVKVEERRTGIARRIVRHFICRRIAPFHSSNGQSGAQLVVDVRLAVLVSD